MKKLLIVMISLALAGTVSAQRFHGGGGGVYYRPHVVVSGGFYPYYGIGYGFGLNPFFPYYPYGSPYYNRPSKLDMQIADVKHDYEDKIKSAKSDESLTRKERRQKVHDLRAQRDDEIYNLKKNYYKY